MRVVGVEEERLVLHERRCLSERDLLRGDEEGQHRAEHAVDDEAHEGEDEVVPPQLAAALHVGVHAEHVDELAIGVAPRRAREVGEELAGEDWEQHEQHPCVEEHDGGEGPVRRAATEEGSACREDGGGEARLQRREARRQRGEKPGGRYERRLIGAVEMAAERPGPCAYLRPNNFSSRPSSGRRGKQRRHIQESPQQLAEMTTGKAESAASRPMYESRWHSSG